PGAFAFGAHRVGLTALPVDDGQSVERPARFCWRPRNHRQMTTARRNRGAPELLRPYHFVAGAIGADPAHDEAPAVARALGRPLCKIEDGIAGQGRAFGPHRWQLARRRVTVERGNPQPRPVLILTDERDAIAVGRKRER